MTKILKALKAAGWVETTLGECHVGEEGLLTQAGPFPRPMQVTQPAECGGEKKRFVKTNDGCARLLDTTPVLREPRPERPEYEPGTVALIRGRGGKSLVRAWRMRGRWILPNSTPAVEDDNVEVVRVLLPADQDTPTVEVTDEMVERVAEAFYCARYEKTSYSPQWDEVRENSPAIAALYRQGARAALKAALEKEK